MRQVIPTLGDDGLTAIGKFLELHTRKEPGQADVIGLAPAFRWMMVALCTFNTNTQQQLAERTAQFVRLGDGLIKCARSFRQRAALLRQQLAGETIVWNVAGKLAAQPSLHCDGPLWSHFELICSQQVQPVHRPVVGVFASLQQVVDQLAPLAVCCVFQERANLVGIRQCSRCVEKSTPHKFCIAGEIARLNSQSLQLVPHQLVDKIRFRRSSEFHARSR